MIREASLLLCAGLALSGCGGGARDAHPLVMDPRGQLSSVGGVAFSANGPPVVVTYLPSKRFGVIFELENRGHHSLRILDVRADMPARSIVHPVATRLTEWSATQVLASTNTRLQSSFWPDLRSALHTYPVGVALHGSAAVELIFELGPCVELQDASDATPDRLEITYRERGKVRHEQLGLRTVLFFLDLRRRCPGGAAS